MTNSGWERPEGAAEGSDRSAGAGEASGPFGAGHRVEGQTAQPDPDAPSAPPPSGPAVEPADGWPPADSWPFDRDYPEPGEPAPHQQPYGEPVGSPWYGSAPPSAYPAAAPWAPAPQRRSGTGRKAAAAGVLALACLGLGFGGGLLGAQVGADRTGNGSIPVATSTQPPRPPDSVAGVAAAVLPSTVSIEVSSGSGQGSGSGFVLRSDGMILTNAHVVQGASGGGDIRVIFADGSQERASVVGRTAAYDLAVLSVPRQGLPPLQLGDSDAVAVGDPVIAIGAPLGLQSTVTTGIVSALHRPVVASGTSGNDDDTFISAIQTDAAINPGNSGGPLVNGAGEVIGINSAIAAAPGTSRSAAGSIGLGFAIPSKQAARTAEQLITDGVATYPVIGVVLDQSYSGEGVRVAQDQAGRPAITPGSPAEEAGIQPGDVIVGFEGRPVTAPSELIVGIRAQAPGDSVSLEVQQNGQVRDVTLVLSESESN